jgi:hypothetical protein
VTGAPAPSSELSVENSGDLDVPVVGVGVIEENARLDLADEDVVVVHLEDTGTLEERSRKSVGDGELVA